MRVGMSLLLVISRNWGREDGENSRSSDHFSSRSGHASHLSARPPTMSRYLLALFLLLPWGLQAQLGNKLRSLVAEDTLAPPDHDTAYIKQYRQELTLSVISNLRLASLEVGDSTGR